MCDPVLTIPQGQLRGRVSTNYAGDKIYCFQGVPYAKAPVGNLRFVAPEPPVPWDGVLDATKDGPECPSTSILIPRYVGREDNCLNLNVFTKSLPAEGKPAYPVMVWIHGGAFVVGSNKTDMYGPEYLLLEDVVLVAINYRLGPLGFLCLEDSSLGVTGNAGMKDQVMGLKWVKNNIQKFNGDPNNITIFGESAGGASVHYLLLSSLTKGLFHKAIIQSGVALNPWATGVRGAKELCKRLKYQETDESKILKHLRELTCYDLVLARKRSRDGFRAGEQRFYGPVIEHPSPDAFISDTPENIIRSGHYNKVPIMIGHTNREGYLFDLVKKFLPYAAYPIEDFIMEVPLSMKIPDRKEERSKLARRVRTFYFGEGKSTDDTEKTYMLKSDTCFVHGIQQAAKLHMNTTTNPIFFYEMSVSTKLNALKKLYTAEWGKITAAFIALASHCGSGYLHNFLHRVLSLIPYSNPEGAAHGDDLMYLFKCGLGEDIAPASKEDQTMRKFVRLWTNFAKYGNPTPKKEDLLDNVRWEPLDSEFTYLDIGDRLAVKNRPYEDRMKFWDELHKEFHN